MRQRNLGRWCAALLAAALCLPWTLAAQAPAQPAYTYTYRLTRSEAQPGGLSRETWFDLTVEGTASDGGAAPPLHAGSIALTGKTALGFTSDGAYRIVSFTGEPGTAEAGKASLGWTWYAAPGAQLAADGARQYLGRVSVGYGSGEAPAEDITLLPWPETQTGGGMYAAWESAPDGERRQELAQLISTTWRAEDGKTPGVGYYQGYYEGPDGQCRADLRCGWQGLEIVSYRPGAPIRLRVYRAEDGAGAPPVATAEVDGQTGVVGRVRTLVRLEKLPGLSQLPDGVYRLEIDKESHTACRISGLTVSGGSVFPQLMGLRVALPCGDVTGDGRIRQADRALLTAPARYGRPVTAGEELDGENLDRYDLDGDGRVGQSDLAILTDPANYGKSDLILSFEPAGGGEA